MNQYHYKAFELHTHTQHSDGQFTVPELCENAVQYQYDGVALTDHNTMSGWQELTPALEARTVPVIRGIEWTTFFGHMVVLNAGEYVDWRFATPDDIDAYTEQIQKVGGTIGVAHPFNIGAPICAGCHWQFNVKKWENIDYIEVWSQPYPMLLYKNPLALAMWTDLLNQGYHLAATSGRDWHGPFDEDGDVHIVATYLGVKDGIINSDTAATAIKAGRTYVTAGPALAIDFVAEGKRYELGETAPAGKAQIKISVDITARRKVWERHNINPKTIRLVQNGEILAETSGLEADFSVDLTKGWVRAEVYGGYIDQDVQLLAFTSPIYVD